MGNFLTHIIEKGLVSRVHKEFLLISIKWGEMDRKIGTEGIC